MTRTDIVRKLNDRLLSMAMEAEADCLATGCPMCQANLDTRQEELRRKREEIQSPHSLLYRIDGISPGHRDTKKWFHRHITDPIKVLSAKGLM